MARHISMFQLLSGVAVVMLSNLDGYAETLAPPKSDCLRVATYNASLNRGNANQLTKDLGSQDEQIRAIAAVIRAVQPDILLVNELDYSTTNDHAALLNKNFLASTQPDALGNSAWPMPFQFSAEVNTGMPSGMDLNNNGKSDDPDDAFGFGRFAGQYGMAVLSRFEIDRQAVVTLQRFPWSKLPNPQRPIDPASKQPFHNSRTWSQLRLSSKSFWDVPIKTPQGTLHVLASHPTPPAFDGPEDRNGCRNHDEIKLIQHYIESSTALEDDNGRPVKFSQQSPFVIMGDLNCDPNDGDSRADALKALLAHPQVASFPAPRSTGGVVAAKTQGKANTRHRSDPAEDTADFTDANVGNLRADYVLPSRHCQPIASGVIWPDLDRFESKQREVVKQLMEASDHHLVWVDLKIITN